MNKTSLALLTLILLLLPTVRMLIKSTNDTIRLYKNNTTCDFYKNITNGITELFLSETEKSQTIPFNQQEITILSKARISSHSIANDTHYYELGQFEDKDNIFKIIIYNTIGESDTPLLNVQLNSYDRKGILLDALLLSTFFGYEDIIRFSHFKISPDYTIAINNYVIHPYEPSEYGTTPHKKNPKPEVYIRAKYKIVKGYFDLTFRDEYK